MCDREILISCGVTPGAGPITHTCSYGGPLNDGTGRYYQNIQIQYYRHGGITAADTDAPRTLVLISPELSNKTIASLITTLKRNLMTCAFSIDEANFYQRVIVIDPDHYFTDDDLIRLDNNGIQVEPIRENVAATLKEKLAG